MNLFANDPPVAPEERPGRFIDVLFVLLGGIALGGLFTAVALVIMEKAFGPLKEMSDVIVGSISSTLVYVGIAAAAQLFFVRRRHLSWRDAGLRRPERGFMGATLLAWTFVFIASIAIAMILRVLVESPPDVREQLGLGNRGIEPGELAWLVVASVIAAPVVEEIVFRGLLLDAFRRRWSFWPSAVTTAVLFGASHRQLLVIPTLTMLGVTLAWLRERFESLYPPMLLHAFNNALAIVLLASLT